MKGRLFYIIILIGSLSFISGTIDLDNLLNYQNQDIPEYITKDNTINNHVTDAGATLGRVLFYDKNLSLNNTISCSSCHLQEFAFGDTAQLSLGVNGDMTVRHAMRLVNARFGSEQHFFWDERALSLEDLSSQPIQDHIEMGFSGTNGQPTLDSLLTKLENIDYYNNLFDFVFGDTEVTEERIQITLSQFIRSIHSFDSKYDIGRAQADNNIQAFPNFSLAENMGKTLFITPPEFDQDGYRISGGAGCQRCHRGPEFDIIPLSRNNGVIGTSSESDLDLTITRAPSLRDLFNPQGQLNGGMMHNGLFTSLEDVINHYDQIPNNPINTNLDPRLRPSGSTQKLNLTDDEKSNLIAFLRTLTGSDMYTNEKWSDPFDENGSLTLVGSSIVSTEDIQEERVINVFPNPASDYIFIEGIRPGIQIDIFNQLGQCITSKQASADHEQISLDLLQSGVYLIILKNNADASFSKSTKLVVSK